MSCCILVGKGEGLERAAFYCNTADWAYGPLMDSYEEAEDFEKWLHKDPRSYDNETLERLYSEFRDSRDSALQLHPECSTLAEVREKLEEANAD